MGEWKNTRHIDFMKLPMDIQYHRKYPVINLQYMIRETIWELRNQRIDNHYNEIDEFESEVIDLHQGVKQLIVSDE